MASPRREGPGGQDRPHREHRLEPQGADGRGGEDGLLPHGVPCGDVHQRPVRDARPANARGHGVAERVGGPLPATGERLQVDVLHLPAVDQESLVLSVVEAEAVELVGEEAAVRGCREEAGPGPGGPAASTVVRSPSRSTS